MAFTYQFGANPTIDYPRMLVGDAVDENHAFEDSEITAAYSICASQFQSSMMYSASAGANLPAAPVSYLRVAALLLDALASSRARLAITKLKDADVDFGKAAGAMRAQASQWREIDDNAGAFVIIEQCHTQAGFIDRFWHEVQRQQVL